MVVERFAGIGCSDYLVLRSQVELEVFLQLDGKRLQAFRVSGPGRRSPNAPKLHFALSHLLLAYALGVGPIRGRQWALLRESRRPERHQDGKRYQDGKRNGHGPGTACARRDRMGDAWLPLHGTPPVVSDVAVGPV